MDQREGEGVTFYRGAHSFFPTIYALTTAPDVSKRLRLIDELVNIGTGGERNLDLGGTWQIQNYFYSGAGVGVAVF